MSQEKENVLDVEALRAMGFPLQSLVLDSREVLPGSTFVACPGTATDGRQFIGQAIGKGAAAVLWEREGFSWNPAWTVPQQPVRGLRKQLSAIAGQLYGHPSRHMQVVGVTGTNGKTSCSQWMASLLTVGGHSCAVMGTLGNGFPGRLEPSLHTTSDAIQVQRDLARFYEQGADTCVMEVSSHGLEQGRVDGVRFQGALFTNLSRDHLDYHETLERYGAAKARLFDFEGLEFVVLNHDDAFGRTLMERVAGRVPQVVSYGLGKAARAEVATHWLGASDIRLSSAGMDFCLEGSWGRSKATTPLLGRFNLSNLLAVGAGALLSGMKFADVCSAVEGLTPPPGRLERLGGVGRPVVVVDYAHTPDALEQVLNVLRELLPPAGRLVCVFGCGGDRDAGKRPLMGEVASRLADVVVVTSDNPRTESPEAIMDQIVAGISGECLRVADRNEAIRWAIEGATAEDVVLLAGKGHEIHQDVQGTRQPFDDRLVAQYWLERWSDA